MISSLTHVPLRSIFKVSDTDFFFCHSFLIYCIVASQCGLYVIGSSTFVEVCFIALLICIVNTYYLPSMWPAFEAIFLGS